MTTVLMLSSPIGADVERAVHGDDAAVVGVVAVDAGDREVARRRRSAA